MSFWFSVQLRRFVASPQGGASELRMEQTLTGDPEEARKLLITAVAAKASNCICVF